MSGIEEGNATYRLYHFSCLMQVIVDELEHERVMLANTISEKLQDHQVLMKVKMDLGMEVAAYRYSRTEDHVVRSSHYRSDQPLWERKVKGVYRRRKTLCVTTCSNVQCIVS